MTTETTHARERGAGGVGGTADGHLGPQQGGTVNGRARYYARRCANPECRLPVSEWPDPTRAQHPRTRHCSDACRYQAKNARERRMVHAMKAGWAAVARELGNDPEEVAYFIRWVQLNEPCGTVVYEGRR